MAHSLGEPHKDMSPSRGRAHVVVRDCVSSSYRIPDSLALPARPRGSALRAAGAPRNSALPCTVPRGSPPPRPTVASLRISLLRARTPFVLSRTLAFDLTVVPVLTPAPRSRTPTAV